MKWVFCGYMSVVGQRKTPSTRGLHILWIETMALIFCSCLKKRKKVKALVIGVHFLSSSLQSIYEVRIFFLFQRWAIVLQITEWNLNAFQGCWVFKMPFLLRDLNKVRDSDNEAGLNDALASDWLKGMEQSWVLSSPLFSAWLLYEL